MVNNGDHAPSGFKLGISLNKPHLLLSDELSWWTEIHSNYIRTQDHKRWDIIVNGDVNPNHLEKKSTRREDQAKRNSKAEGQVRSQVSKARYRPPKPKVRQPNARRILNPNKPISISTVLDVNEGDLTMSCTNATKPVKVWEATT